MIQRLSWFWVTITTSLVTLYQGINTAHVVGVFDTVYGFINFILTFTIVWNNTNLIKTLL